MDVNQLIAEHGTWFYLIAFVWTFLEGETVVLCAGFAAAQGLVSPIALLAAAWLGSYAGDQSYFWLGRHFGRAILDRFPGWHSGVAAALHFLERYNTGFILSFRFIYGVRNLSSFAVGLSAVPWRRFCGLNFIAAGLWATSFIAVGYFLGHALRAVLGDLVRSFNLVTLAAFVAFAVIMGSVHRRQRRRRFAIPPGIKPAVPPL